MIYLVALLFGLVSQAHCAAMCGPIALVLAGGERGVRGAARAGWSQLGRLASYSALGAIVGVAAHGLARSDTLRPFLYLLVALPLLGIGLRRMGILPSGALALGDRALVPARRLLRSERAAHRVAFGAVWGLLPCGMVFAALSLAASTHEPIGGALVMFLFGLGTLPVLVLTAFLLGGRELGRRIDRAIGVALVLGAFVQVGMLIRSVDPPLARTLGLSAPCCDQHRNEGTTAAISEWVEKRTPLPAR